MADRLWHDRDFSLFWTARTISLFGDQITLLALPLAAALWLGATPAQMGLLTATSIIPIPLLGLFAGAWVDRRARRPLLIRADLARAVVLGTVPVLWLLGALRIELLYAVSLLAGCWTAVFDMAKLAYTPSVVKREQLLEANSRLELSQSVVRVAGPGLSGLLVQLVTGPIAVVLDVVSYLVSAALIGRIRVTEAPNAPGRHTSLLAEIGVGLKAVVGHPLLRPLALTLASLNLFHGVIASQIVLFLTEDLQLAPGVMGLVFGVGGCGAIIGSAIAARLTQRNGPGRTLILAVTLLGLGALLLPLAGGPPAITGMVVCLARAASGMGGAILAINDQSLRQAVTSDALQGRVNATNHVVLASTFPLGAVLGGLLAEAIGVRPALMMAGVGVALSVLWLLMSPLRALHRTPQLAGF